MTENTGVAATVPAVPDEPAGLGYTVLGVVLFAIGLWLLFVSPGDGTEIGGREIANVHRLAIGTASTVSGIVLLGVGSVLRTITRAPK